MTPHERSQHGMSGQTEYSFQIFSRLSQQAKWTLHASGQILPTVLDETQQDDSKPPAALALLQAECHQEVNIKEYYEKHKEEGLDYGPSFQAIVGLWRNEPRWPGILGNDAPPPSFPGGAEGQALGEIQLPESLLSQISDYKLHPVLLNACLQVLKAALSDDAAQAATYMPVGIERLQRYRSPSSRVWSYVTVQAANNLLTAEVSVFAPNGELIAVINGLRLKEASRGSILWQDPAGEALGKRRRKKSLPKLNWLYKVEWRTQVRQEGGSESAVTPIVCNDCKLGNKPGESFLIC